MAAVSLRGLRVPAVIASPTAARGDDYRRAGDDADAVVIAVVPPTSLRWIDRCTATAYRSCGRGEPPAAFAATLR